MMLFLRSFMDELGLFPLYDLAICCGYLMKKINSKLVEKLFQGRKRSQVIKIDRQSKF